MSSWWMDCVANDMGKKVGKYEKTADREEYKIKQVFGWKIDDDN